MICSYHMIDMHCNTCIIWRLSVSFRGLSREMVMKWITRERPKIDRIACPWLIARFIDPDAEFLYVPAAKVMDVAKEAGAPPYDGANVDHGHHGEKCSFVAFLVRAPLAEPAPQRPPP